MSPSNTASVCLDCNSRAVDCLQQGNPKEAAVLLRAALAKLQQDATIQRTVNAPLSPKNQDKCMSSFTYGSIYGVSVSPDLLNTPFFQSQENLFSCYFRAFEADEFAQETLHVNTVFVIVLHNLALSMLLEGVHKGRRISRTELTYVFHLFQAAMKAANVAWGQGLSEEVLCVVLGITSNMGYLHSLCRNCKEAKEHLLLALELVANHAAEEVVPLDDYEFFHNNTCMFASGVHLNSAPAA